MKRLIAILFVLGFIVALPLSHAFAARRLKPGKRKVFICHVTNVEENHHGMGHVLLEGHLIKVARAAVSAHLEHGDFRPRRLPTDAHAGDYCNRHNGHDGHDGPMLPHM